MYPCTHANCMLMLMLRSFEDGGERASCQVALRRGGRRTYSKNSRQGGSGYVEVYGRSGRVHVSTRDAPTVMTWYYSVTVWLRCFLFGLSLSHDLLVIMSKAISVIVCQAEQESNRAQRFAIRVELSEFWCLL